MQSIEECRDGLKTVLKIYRAGLTGRKQMIRRLAPNMVDGGKAVAGAMAAAQQRAVADHLGVLNTIFDVLVAHDCPAAVKVIRKTFSCDCVPFRMVALMALGRMTDPSAKKALSRRTSWLCGATKEEKELARSLFEGFDARVIELARSLVGDLGTKAAEPLRGPATTATAASAAAAEEPRAERPRASESAAGEEMSSEARRLAQQVRELVRSAFAAPGPLFTESRQGIFEQWFANFAKNLDAVADAINSGRDMDGQPVSVAQTADGLQRMCDQYGQPPILRRLEGVCGAEVRGRFEGMLQSAAALVSTMAGPPGDAGGRSGEAEARLSSQVAEILGAASRSQAETRRLADYPLLVRCSQQFAGGKPPTGSARSLTARLEELVRSEADFDLAYMWLAICQDAADDFPAAVQTLLEGIRRSKRKGHLCATLAEESMDRGHLDISLRAAAKAVDLGTELYIAHHIMAEALEFHGMNEEANALRTRVPTVLEDHMRDRIRTLVEQQDTAQTREFVRAFASGLGG